LLNRRTFLRSLGATVLAAPFVELLLYGEAAAQQSGPRLLIFHSPNGTVHHKWRPEIDGEQFSLRAGSITEPLAPVQDEIVIVDGLDFYTGNNHEGGAAAMLTNGGGARTVTGGASLDQVVAAHIGQESRFSSLELGVNTDVWGSSTQTRISYRGAGQLVQPDSDPRHVYGRMFGEAMGDADAAEKLRRRRQSVIDFNRHELDDLKRRLGTAERRKLDAHLGALRQVERGIAGTVEDCGVPPRPEYLNKNLNENVPAILAHQMDLAILALTCGMTRVASVQFSHTVSPVVFTWAGNTSGHHSLSHASDRATAELQEFVDAERWVAGQFASLVQRLRDTIDPLTDAPMLDNTIVLWAKEMGDSRAHVCTSVPFVLAGGGNRWRKNRYLHGGGVSHSHLLVSLAREFGIDIDTFGDPNTGTGPLAGLV
jgi:hypothetical protein